MVAGALAGAAVAGEMTGQVYGEASGGLGEFFESAASIINKGISAIDSPIATFDAADIVNAIYGRYYGDDTPLLKKPIRCSPSPLDLLAMFWIGNLMAAAYGNNNAWNRMQFCKDNARDIIDAFMPKWPVPELPKIPDVIINETIENIGTGKNLKKGGAWYAKTGAWGASPALAGSYEIAKRTAEAAGVDVSGWP